MGNKTRGGGLLALGLAAAAYWIWGMKKEDKDKVKAKVADAGNKIKEKIPQDLKDKIDGLLNKSKGSTTS